MTDPDITKALRKHATHLRQSWSDLQGKPGDVYYDSDMQLAALLERTAFLIDGLYGEVRDLKQRNVRLLSQIQELEAREQ